MAKPSIFSRDYEQKMKRRKINIILFILLLVCMAFFGGLYYLKKNNISIMPDFISNIGSSLNNKEEKPKKEDKVESNVKEPVASVLVYEYKAKDSTTLNIEYSKSEGKNEFKGIKGLVEGVDFSISKDKQKIVFVDKGDQSLILYNIDGTLRDITKESVSYKTGKKLTRSILETKKDFIWNAMPQFTADGSIVYLSDMPNQRPGAGLTIWRVSPESPDKHTKTLKVPGDIASLKFEGFDEKGILKLNTVEGYLYISENGTKASNIG
ncbi:MAG: hypothetical protein RR898_10295 [Clostridium sp.]|uniref:hypothetical protein n=1 Tax=Clostridium sp. TaxID=1506 RepID=UPI002FC76F0D